MTGTVAMIRHREGEIFPGLDLDRTRDALAAYVATRWPSGRRKHVAREFDLSEDEARSVCSGRASWATWDKIINHKRGGWTVVLPVLGALFNQTIEEHLAGEARKYAENSRRLLALVERPHVGVPYPDGQDRQQDRRRRA